MRLGCIINDEEIERREVGSLMICDFDIFQCFYVNKKKNS